MILHFEQKVWDMISKSRLKTPLDKKRDSNVPRSKVDLYLALHYRKTQIAYRDFRSNLNIGFILINHSTMGNHLMSIF